LLGCQNSFKKTAQNYQKTHQIEKDARLPQLFTKTAKNYQKTHQIDKDAGLPKLFFKKQLRIIKKLTK
jgi:hypothetical protein